MSLKFRGPMFAPEGGGSGGNDDEALTRIAIKKARAAAQEAFADLLEGVGFESVDAFKAFVKESKKSRSEAAEKAAEAERAAAAAKQNQGVDKPDPKDAPPVLKLDAIDTHEDVMKAAQELMSIKIDMAASGVKKEDLDWAANRYLQRKSDLPPSGVAAFNVENYVANLKTEHPTVFRDAAVTPPPAAGADGKPPAPQLGNSGNGAPPAAPSGNVGFDARRSDITPAQVQARLNEVLKS